LGYDQRSNEIVSGLDWFPTLPASFTVKPDAIVNIGKRIAEQKKSPGISM